MEEVKATRAQVTKAVVEAELAKQLRPPLTDQQRAFLINELLKLQPSVQRLDEMKNSVFRRQTFGTIAFEHWVADVVMTEEDTKQAMEEIRKEGKRLQRGFEDAVNVEIAKRMEIARKASGRPYDSKQRDIAELIAQEIAAREMAADRLRYFDEIYEYKSKLYKILRKRLALLSKEKRVKVLEMAVRRGLVKSFDESMVDHLPLFADVVMPIFRDKLEREHDKPS